MPIYGYGVIGAPWTVCTEMKITTLMPIIDKFIKNQHKLTSFGHEAFIKTLDFNSKMKECYVASYDMGKSNIDEFNYMKCMQELLKIMNDEYKTGKKAIYKFDIAGTWTSGRIIIMVKK